jgi:hypothetical protein
MPKTIEKQTKADCSLEEIAPNDMNLVDIVAVDTVGDLDSVAAIIQNRVQNIKEGGASSTGSGLRRSFDSAVLLNLRSSRASRHSEISDDDMYLGEFENSLDLDLGSRPPEDMFQRVRTSREAISSAQQNDIFSSAQVGHIETLQKSKEQVKNTNNNINGFFLNFYHISSRLLHYKI